MDFQRFSIVGRALLLVRLARIRMVASSILAGVGRAALLLILTSIPILLDSRTSLTLTSWADKGMGESELVKAFSSLLGTDVSPTAENAHRYRPAMLGAVNQVMNFLGASKGSLMESLDTVSTPEATRAKKLLGALPTASPFSEAVSGLVPSESPIASAVDGVMKQRERAQAVDDRLGAAANSAADTFSLAPESVSTPIRGGGSGAGADYEEVPDSVKRWAPEVRKISKEIGADPALVLAMLNSESRGDASAVSNRGAMGLMQLKPSTASDLGVNPKSPVDNIRGGAKYITSLISRYKNLSHALAAYNWGMGNVDRWLKRGGDEKELPSETRKYIAEVQSNFERFA